MSMSTHIVALVEPTEESRKKAAVWHACKDAGIQPPGAVER